MSKKISVVVALMGMCALSLFLLSCGSSSSRPSGLLYVLTQGSNGTGNNVSSFAIDLSSGNLSLINSNASTCKPAGGSCGLPLNIVLDPTGATAFVLNQGVPCEQDPTTKMCVVDKNKTPTVSVPPTIYPYTVGSDGSLSSPGTPTLLSHPLPPPPPDTEDDADIAVAMVRDAAGQFLFVINQGSNPAPANCPHEPDPTKEFDACPSISVFTMKPGSTGLTLAGGEVVNGKPAPLRLSKIPTALSTVTYTPPNSTTAQELLFVTNSVDICTTLCNPLHNDNTLSEFTVSSSGVLAELTPNSPYATNTDPLSVLAVNTNQPGQNSSGGVFVYVGSQPAGSGALSIFQLCTVVGIAGCTPSDVTNAILLPVGTSPTSVGQNPVGMVVDPTNNFLYVVCEGSSQVFGFRITTTTGVLTAPANLATGSQPVALAMHSTGKFLYTSNSISSSISAFTVSTTSGSMTSLSTVTSPAGPSGMAAR